MKERTEGKRLEPIRSSIYIDSEKQLITQINRIFEVDCEVLTMEDYMDTDAEYEVFIKNLFELLNSCYDLEECRHHAISFRFYHGDKTVYSLPFDTFLLNAVSWMGLIPAHQIANNVFDKHRVKGVQEMREITKNINDFVNDEIFGYLRSIGVSSKKSKYAISQMSYYFRQVNRYFWDTILFNVSMLDVFELFDDPEMHELMLETIPKGLQPHEIENILNDVLVRLEKIVKRIGDKNGFTRMAMIPGYIKLKQLRELLVMIGTRPNVFNQTIPYGISNSYMIGGATKPSEMYIESGGNFIPAFNNSREMGTSGYFSKKASLLCSTLRMDKSHFDCGSTYYIPYQIKTKKHLKKLVGKFYINEQEKLVPVKDTDTHLIGTTIRTRSIATCQLGQDYCCPVCAGINANTILDYENFGSYSAQDAVMQIGQDILSTKHLLATASQLIRWCENFFKFFTMEGSNILFLPDSLKEFDIADYVNFKLVVNPSDIITDDDFSMSDEDDCLSHGKFQVHNTETGEVFDIYIEEDENGSTPDLNITKSFSKLLELTNYEPSFADLMNMESIIKHGKKTVSKTKRKTFHGEDGYGEEDNTDNIYIGDVFATNYSITKTLTQITHLINNKSGDEYRKDVETYLQRLLDLYVESNLPPHVNSIEVIVNRLMVDYDHSTPARNKNGNSCEDGMIRPKIHNGVIEPYTIERMDTVLMYNPSPEVRMLYRYLNKQLFGTADFLRVDKPYTSIFDSKIPTDTFGNITDEIEYGQQLEKRFKPFTVKR